MGGLSLTTEASASIISSIEPVFIVLLAWLLFGNKPSAKLWLYLIGLAGAAGLWLNLIPVFGVTGAYFWLGEIPTLLMLMGMGLIIGAIITGWLER